MKKILLAFGFSVLALCYQSCTISNASNEKNTKLPSEGKTYDVKPFTAIKANGIFNIILSQGTKESVVVKGELPAGLSVSNDKDTLVINDTLNLPSNHSYIKTDIYITLKVVKSITIESVGETKCGDTLKLKSLCFKAEGVGSITLLVNADTVYAYNQGVGKLTMAGEVAFSTVDDAGVGALDASAFKAGILHVNVSGVGAAKVYAIKEIYLITSGVGGVEYSGPAKVMQNESSGVGQVEHTD